MVKNAVGRELPEKIGNYVVKPYKGPGAELDWDKPACTNRVPRLSPAGGSKVAASLKDAIIKSGLKDGQTISFHHCFREGDMVSHKIWGNGIVKDIILNNENNNSKIRLAINSILIMDNNFLTKCLNADYERIFKDKGYAYYKGGNYDLNIIGIRKNIADVKELATNKFDDIIVVKCIANNKPFMSYYVVTTQPGITSLKTPVNAKGCAILVPGQYRGCWKIGLHKGKYKEDKSSYK